MLTLYVFGAGVLKVLSSMIVAIGLWKVLVADALLKSLRDASMLGKA